MTGLDPARHVIVEIATLITDDDLAVVAEGPDLVVHADRHQVARWTPRPDHAHPVGLLEQNQGLADLLQEAAGKPSSSCASTSRGPDGALCGNSIGTDRRFLSTQLPEIEASSITGRSTSPASRSSAGAGIRRSWPRSAQVEAHRALDDIRESIAELAYYRSTIFVTGPR